MSRRPTLEFLRTETGAGVVLAGAALAALVWANSPAADSYAALATQSVPVQIGPFAQVDSLRGWISSALMPVFAFVLGLQVKYELLRGEFASPRRLLLPLAAAFGGVALPALLIGLAAPESGARLSASVADLSLAMAALTAAGPRLPGSLRIFLLAVILAGNALTLTLAGLLASGLIRLEMAAGAMAALAVLAGMGRWRSAPYVFWALGAGLLWAFTFKAGLSTVLAGLAAAVCVPLAPRAPGRPGMLQEMQEALHPYVAYLILPLFLITAAGFPLSALAAPQAWAPVLAVTLALVAAKAAGVFGAVLLVTGLKWGRRPTGAHWSELLGAALLSGIALTPGLYVAGLGGVAADPASPLRAGVVAGSLVAGVLGMALLAAAQARRDWTNGAPLSGGG